MTKTIWHTKIAVEELNNRNHGTLASYMNIRCTDIGNDFIAGEMEITENHLQPNGIMNGGASCVFAETLASTAANYCVDANAYICVGQGLSTNHIRPAKIGRLRAVATPTHLGRSSQIWEIKIYNTDNKIISLSVLTLAVIKKG